MVVSGLPGSGKSTLAAQLRDDLALPLLSLDTVKEAVVDGLASDAPADRFAVRRAAATVLVQLAAANPRGAVVDVWIDPHRDASGFCAALKEIPGARFVEVVCRVPADVAVDRYAQRRRHPAHLPMDADTEQRIRAAAPMVGPLGLGPHRDVCTATPLDEPRRTGLLSWLARQGVPSRSTP